MYLPLCSPKTERPPSSMVHLPPVASVSFFLTRSSSAASARKACMRAGSGEDCTRTSLSCAEKRVERRRRVSIRACFRRIRIRGVNQPD